MCKFLLVNLCLQKLKSQLRIFFALFILLIPKLVLAQQPGMANSNLSTTQSVILNPSRSADPKINTDVTLFSMSSFFKNNYVYAPKNNFKLTDLQSIKFEEDFMEENKYAMHYELDMMLPSFSKAIYQYGFGGFVRVRAMVNAHNIPSHLARFFYQGFDYSQQHDEQYKGGDFMIKSMSWAEVGFNFSRLVYQFNSHQLSAGVNVKRLFGAHNAGGYFANSDYEVVKDTVNIYLLNGNFGFAMPNQTLPGKGWGMDIGFTYKKTLRPVNRYVPYSKFSSCEKRPYDYRIGLSFLDIGGIRFNQNTTRRTFENAATDWKNYPETNLSSLEGFDNDITSRFGTKITSENTYWASLPTSVVLEIDKRFRNFFFLNATGLYNFRLRENLGVARLGFFALTPRIELNKIEASLPITLYGFKSPAFGATLKFGGIFLGTNNLVPWLVNVDVYGIDLFFGFKFSVASNKECKPVIEDRKNWWCPSCENDEKKKK